MKDPVPVTEGGHRFRGGVHRIEKALPIIRLNMLQDRLTGVLSGVAVIENVKLLTGIIKLQVSIRQQAHFKQSGWGRVSKTRYPFMCLF